MLAKNINNLIGVLVFGFSITRIPDLIFIFLNFTKASNGIVFFRLVFKLANWFGFMILATSLNNKVTILILYKSIITISINIST